MPKLVVVGAHAGDGEVMAGPVVAQHTASGGVATLVHLSLGELGHPLRSRDAYAEQKRGEALAAATTLGASCRILPYQDSALAGDREAKLAMAEVIRDERPAIVITHWSGSFHRDHALCHEIVCEAVFYAGLGALWPNGQGHLVSALYFGENWEDGRGFHPELYVETAAGHEAWLAALREYELFRGGVSTFPYMRYYEALSVVRGAECGSFQAKAFAVPPEAARAVVRDLTRDVPFPVLTGASILARPNARRRPS